MTPPAVDTVSFRRWVDVVVDEHGHTPFSTYAEFMWLPIIGPTSLWLLRRVTMCLDATGDETVTLPVGELAMSLGVGSTPQAGKGRRAPLQRSIDRLHAFGLAHSDPDGTVAVRCVLPTLTQQRVRRLPDQLRVMHDRLQVREAAIHATAVAS